MLVTLVERKRWLYLVKWVVSKQAEVVRDAIIEMLTPYIDQVHSIAFDKGGEVAGERVMVTKWAENAQQNIAEIPLL